MQDGVHDALAEMAGAATKKEAGCMWKSREYLRWTDGTDAKEREKDDNVRRVGLVHDCYCF